MDQGEVERELKGLASKFKGFKVKLGPNVPEDIAARLEAQGVTVERAAKPGLLGADGHPLPPAAAPEGPSPIDLELERIKARAAEILETDAKSMLAGVVGVDAADVPREAVVQALREAMTTVEGGRPRPRLAARELPVVVDATPRGGRACGQCTACCFVIGVRAVPSADVRRGLADPRPPADKLPMHRCEHDDGKGCAIYADPSRPKACAAYACGWLLGIFGQERDRPDRLGVVVDSMKDPGVVHAREVRTGAFHGKRARALLEDLHRAGNTVHLVPFMDRRVPTGKPL